MVSKKIPLIDLDPMEDYRPFLISNSYLRKIGHCVWCVKHQDEINKEDCICYLDELRQVYRWL